MTDAFNTVKIVLFYYIWDPLYLILAPCILTSKLKIKIKIKALHRNSLLKIKQSRFNHATVDVLLCRLRL